MHFDVFNGDADGLLALHQIRLETPRDEATLVTGVKRDIMLLSQLGDVRNSSITVLDISLNSNREALLNLLAHHNTITYIDHHFAGEIPVAKGLEVHIDPCPTLCTSLIVDKLLKGKYRSWAVAAAFGDNLHDAAREAARPLHLSIQQLDTLRELGELLNYNGYGATLSDLHFPPETLYQAIHPHKDPFSFIADSPVLATLRQGFREDMDLALEQEEVEPRGRNRVYSFPNAPWSRRVAGVFSNLRAREKTDAAHALVIENDDRTLRISVRAPLEDRKDADTLCLAFPTGGGRAGAAGINELPPQQLGAFLRSFQDIFSQNRNSPRQ